MDITQILPRVKTASPSPIYELMENDQTFPAGMWRWRVQGDVAILERATAVNWASDEDWLACDKGNNWVQFLKSLVPYADNVIDLGSAALSWANVHVQTIVYATTVHGSWSPDTDDTYYLGTATAGWKGIHLPDVLVKDDATKIILRNSADTAYAGLDALEATLYGANGLDVNPGSDTDADLVTVVVTGSPKIWWDESEDSFIFTKGISVTPAVVQAFKAEYNITAQLGAWVHGVKVELTRAADIQPSTGAWFGGQFVLNAGSAGYTALDKAAYALQAIFKGSDTSPDGVDIHVARFETQSAGKVSDITYITANSGTTIVGSLLYIATHVIPGYAIETINVQNSQMVPEGLRFVTGAGSSINYGIDFNDATINNADLRIKKAILPSTNNVGDIGSAALKLANIYATNVHAGDIIFRNGWKLIETKRGLALVNPEGEVVDEWV